MDEPPILPPRQPQGGDQPSRAIEDTDNPFAPSNVQTDSGPQAARVELPAEYWVVMVVAMLLMLLGTIVLSGLTLPGIVALVGAVVRVPLLQLRLTRGNLGYALPNPLLLLLTSWALMLTISIASLFAFMVVCVPAALLAFGVTSGEATWGVVLALSGTAALTCYIFLFRLSLRLPM